MCWTTVSPGAAATPEPTVEVRTPSARANVLSTWATNPIEFVEADQHVARLGSVRRSKHAGGVQLVDDSRRAAVADLEPPLEQRGRAALVLDHDLRRLAEQLVPVADVSSLPVALPGLERFLLPHCLQNVRLRLERLFQHEPLRGEGGALGVPHSL